MSVIKRILSNTLRQFSALLICVCSLSSVSQANPRLISDIETTLEGLDSNPDEMTELNGQLIFSAETKETGRELFASNGTTSWWILANINPDNADSDPGGFTVFENAVYFFANDGVHGNELWKTDGTDIGTVLVKDINPGSEPSRVRHYSDKSFVSGGVLYFYADDGVHGVELWKTDGTEAGTTLVHDINPGSDNGIDALRFNPVEFKGQLYFRAVSNQVSSLWKTNGTDSGTEKVKHNINPQHLTIMNNAIYFDGYDHLNGRELWKTDGSEAGTVLVKDIRAGIDHSSPTDLITIGNNIYFVANNGVHGRELWKSDGTEVGTVLIKDINSGATSSILGSLEFDVKGQELFFAADDGVHGWELWKTDGSDGGTVLVKDIADGSSGSYVRNITVLGNNLYFGASNLVTGFELWKSDGTESGTEQVLDIRPYASSSLIGVVTTMGEMLYFSADDGIHGRELWKSDGTASGTMMLADIQENNTTDSKSARFYEANGVTFFNATMGGQGRGLWKEDPTGASLVKQLYPGFSSVFERETIVAGNWLYFTSSNYSTYGNELWKTDGATTTLVKDIFPGATGSFPRILLSIDNYLIFAATDSSGAMKLWRTDGTEIGTIPFEHSSPSGNLFLYSNRFDATIYKGDLFFTASDQVHGYELWKTNGAAASISMVEDVVPGIHSSSPENLTVVNDELYFLVRNAARTRAELWKTDGVTTSLVEIVHGSFKADIEMKAVGDTLFFTLFDDVHGMELWKTDGVTTSLVKDIKTGNEGSFPSSLTAVGNRLYFIADDGIHGKELWATNGTQAGTQLVADIMPGALSSSINALTVAADTYLYFTADDGIHGHELWKSDGLNASLVRDIRSGIAGGYPRDLVVVDDKLVFHANDGNFGRELWVTDGSSAGTKLAFDLVSGVRSSYPDELSVIGNKVYFSADDAVHGREPWNYEVSTVVVPGTMGDFVWNDMNGNGIQDDNEVGIANVEIDLLTCSGSVIDSTTSDADGKFLFERFGLGQYQMRYHLSAGYRFSPTNQGGNYSTDSNAHVLTGLTPCLSLASGQKRLALDAGMVADNVVVPGTGIIGDYIWGDLNGNGIQESYELGLANVQVDMMSCSGSVLSTTSTDATGQYRFSNLGVGSYQLYYHLPVGYRYSPTGQGGNYRTDSNANSTTGLSPCLPMKNGQQRLAIDAGMVPDVVSGTGVMGDFVWDDVNGNGIQESNEPGLSNVIVDLQSCNGALLESTVTNAAGNFSFEELATGRYQMYFHLPTGYSYSPAGQGGDYRTDSNVNRATGLSPCLMIDGHQRIAVDAGMNQ